MKKMGKKKVSSMQAAKIRAMAKSALGRSYVKPDKDSGAGAAT